ncbi:hypothetical protein B0T17DRAFT_339870 [Bombardia bombarda]|uniref:Uncharacterized protein n=1 Tax=Bombardia bombarda TaxID=252184 RepID=A0AA40BYL1_9PEZI|nr:hypothetical protein B0T17DRAFT_339870 [Bombardia bombarda]
MSRQRLLLPWLAVPRICQCGWVPVLLPSSSLSAHLPAARRSLLAAETGRSFLLLPGISKMDSTWTGSHSLRMESHGAFVLQTRSFPNLAKSTSQRCLSTEAPTHQSPVSGLMPLPSWIVYVCTQGPNEPAFVPAFCQAGCSFQSARLIQHGRVIYSGLTAAGQRRHHSVGFACSLVPASNASCTFPRTNTRRSRKAPAITTGQLLLPHSLPKEGALNSAFPPPYCLSRQEKNIYIELSGPTFDFRFLPSSLYISTSSLSSSTQYQHTHQLGTISSSWSSSQVSATGSSEFLHPQQTNRHVLLALHPPSP